MSLHASAWNAGRAALNDAVKVERVGGRKWVSQPGIGKEVAVGTDEHCIGLAKGGLLPVVSILVLFVVVAEEAQAQTDVQGEPRGDVKIVVDVGFDVLVAVVVLGLTI